MNIKHLLASNRIINFVTFAHICTCITVPNDQTT